jgi:hypothetical protein
MAKATPKTIMPAFGRFQDEAAIIGRILAGYAELEIELCLCVAMAKDDFDLTFKTMFRTRGETNRVQMADIVGRPCFHKFNLGSHFESAISDVKHCLKIRNQYAHCQWYDDFGRQLGIVQLEDLADKNQPVLGLAGAEIKRLDLTLLEKQEAYFVYTRDLLQYLNFECQKQAGKISKNIWSIPKKGKQPILYNP